MKQLNHKLVTENAIIVQADRSKTVVIINSDKYSKKVHTILVTYNFILLSKDPIDKNKKLV
jgi:hypothetical protein